MQKSEGKGSEGGAGENRSGGPCFLHNFESGNWRNGKRHGKKKEKLSVVKPFLVPCSMEAKLVRKPFK